MDSLPAFGDELDSPITVVSTGGLGHVITPLTSSIDHYDPWLTLAGIRTVYGLNVVSN